MSRNAIIEFRRTGIFALKGEPSITSLVPAASIYPPLVTANPAWPFIRWGVFTAVPYKAACLNGSILTGAIHAYAKGADTDAGIIGGAIHDFFDGPDGMGLSLTLEDGRRVNVTTESSQVIQDGSDANNWHAIINIRAAVTG